MLSFIFLHFLQIAVILTKKVAAQTLSIMCYLARHNVNDPESVIEGFGALSKHKIEGDDETVKGQLIYFTILPF